MRFALACVCLALLACHMHRPAGTVVSSTTAGGRGVHVLECPPGDYKCSGFEQELCPSGFDRVWVGTPMRRDLFEITCRAPEREDPCVTAKVCR